MKYITEPPDSHDVSASGFPVLAAGRVAAASHAGGYFRPFY
jgi:hypothetical protein